jgi:superfamily II DNA or RNA helicase
MERAEIQEEALKATEGRRRCSVVLGTGVGKTLVGLTHMDRNTTPLMKCLVVAPKKAIFQSWKDDAVKFDKHHLLGRIVFTTYLSLNKHNPNDYDVVYLDEMHSLLDSHRGFLQLFKGKILGLTGTPPKRGYSEKGKLVQEFCPVVYTFKADDAIENGILIPMEATPNAKFLISKLFPAKAIPSGYMILNTPIPPATPAVMENAVAFLISFLDSVLLFTISYSFVTDNFLSR